MGNVYICYSRHLAHFFKSIIQVLLTSVVIHNPYKKFFFFGCELKPEVVESQYKGNYDRQKVMEAETWDRV